MADSGQAAITGMAATTAFGRGLTPVLDGVLAGTPAFGGVTRFAPRRCRANAAAELPGTPVLAEELAAVIEAAWAAAGLADGQRAGCPLLLALHCDPAAARDPDARQVTGDTAAAVAGRCGLGATPRIYMAACVAASTAVIDAAAMFAAGQASRVVVAAGYLVDADSFAMFDAGRSLAPDGQVRPFSAGRRGMLLGDGVAAVVLEAAATAAHRDAPVLARLAGWGRSGDAYHVCQPRPDGSGLARAVGMALARAGADPAEIGYVNANGTGTPFSDASEAAALHTALGARAALTPVSSTKSVHGHALEASGLVELIVTVLALRSGQLPVNAGFLGPDDECRLDLVLTPGRERQGRYALSLNAAFGGANTALLVEAA
ncbi:MAG TPA: beta-ketoacyl synthase N-terminal-like domain-containing protein [Streptosporangiaceae bacterium]|jgi:3-oxoacyl-(acyl-carrier-protein) synthase|nr:beta-ketoacyl synthase N-terminal-like domain-containing protein [Streptosporangiaceae bacterium]